MADIKIELDADAIQHQVTQAILDSAIGTSLKKSLEDLAKQWKVDTYWDSSLKKVVEQHVQSIISQRVRERLDEHIKQYKNELVSDEVINAAVEYACNGITFKTRY